MPEANDIKGVDTPAVDTNAATDVIGKSKIFTPEVINDIHVKSELGRYRMRGFSLFKKIPHWDELVLLPGTLTRFVIENGELAEDLWCVDGTILRAHRCAAGGGKKGIPKNRMITL